MKHRYTLHATDYQLKPKVVIASPCGWHVRPVTPGERVFSRQGTASAVVPDGIDGAVLAEHILWLKDGEVVSGAILWRAGGASAARVE